MPSPRELLLDRLKLLLALVGFGLAGIGVAIEEQVLVGTAMGVLAGALAIRLWLRRRRSEAPPDE